MPKKPQTDATAEPDALVREKAGRYRSGDGRFTVQQADTGWYLIDAEQTNELGQELMHGPFPTLNAVRDAIPGAREVTPLPRSRRRPKAPPRRRRAEPPPPPPSWIDRLPSAEAAEVRRLIRALEREGVVDAEAVVRRDREGMAPAVATRLIEHRLATIVDELPAPDRDAARKVVARVARLLIEEGRPRGPLPGWALVERGGEPDPANRRIRIS